MEAKLKELAGEPRTGIHSYRIPYVDLAFVDVGLTALGGYAIAKWFDWSVPKTIGGLMIVSVPIHMYFGVNTKIVETIKPN